MRLVDDGVSTITLDLAEVAFIDSSGLRALVVGHKALEEQGGSLVVANPSTHGGPAPRGHRPDDPLRGHARRLRRR